MSLPVCQVLVDSWHQPPHRTPRGATRRDQKFFVFLPLIVGYTPGNVTTTIARDPGEMARWSSSLDVS